MIFNLIFSVLLLTIFILFLVPRTNVVYLRTISLSSSCVVFILSCFFFVSFDCNNSYFQYFTSYSLNFEFFNIYLSFGLDGVSLFFFILSSFLIFLCILFIWDEPLFKEYSISLIALDLLLLVVFSVLDLLLFYMFFEAILIPMYLIIGVWGSRERKVRAVYLFFFIL